MDYKKISPTKDSPIEIRSNYLKFDDTLLQIINIVATNISTIIIPYNEPEPTFTLPEPRIDFGGIANVLVISAIIILLLYNFYDSTIAYTIIAVITFFIIYAEINDRDNKYSLWEKEREDYTKVWNAWNKLKQDPPVVYELSITTNSTLDPFKFFSYNKSQILSINETINRESSYDYQQSQHHRQ
jgi:hypothetical protein